ncbi:MAG: winged helix-turn-helix transcriptional regulator [Acidobacteria bacterium]|nr:winged helix-turn-helix transcriptional regulator [Acidobacteriota bacterium]
MDYELTLNYLIMKAYEEFMADVFPSLAAAGYGDIQPAYRHVFPYIAIRGARLTEIAAQAGLTKQAVGYLVDSLEALGYVERVPDPTDRRAKIVRFTERGRAQDRVAQASFAATERRLVKALGREDVAELRRILARMRAHQKARQGTE